MLNKFIVSTCDDTHHGWQHHWKDFHDDFIWLYHSQNGVKDNFKNLHYTEEEMKKTIGYTGPDKPSPRHYWNSFGNRNLIWFYPHFRMLHYFANRDKDYDYYWFFDDDVTCDNWKGFINSFDDKKEDFISWFVFQKEDYKKHLPTLDADTTSQHMWFERFPGEGDHLPFWIFQWYGSFFPVVRISHNALNTLWNITQNNLAGKWGYSEGWVPTILNGYGHTLGSLFKKDGTSDYFNVDEINIKHKHQKIEWNWI